MRYAYDTAGDAKAHVDALGAVERRFAELEKLRREQRRLLLADEDEAATVAVTKMASSSQPRTYCASSTVAVTKSSVSVSG